VVVVEFGADQAKCRGDLPRLAGRPRSRLADPAGLCSQHGASPFGRHACIILRGGHAFAGQGVVAETLNFSQLPGYRTGGTVHFVINNQIGFTTLPADARSTRYCTDVAKMIEAPIFHVNGDDPEAVCFVTSLALEFRCLFHRDAVVDMYCYRKHGHNESDEPAFTQPTLYKKVAAHPQISTIYTARLIAAATHTQADADAIKAEYSAAMDASLEKAKHAELKRHSAGVTGNPFRDSNAIFQAGYSHAPVAAFFLCAPSVAQQLL
jgi:2-oxoglutarate dehydrogenase E1 component